MPEHHYIWELTNITFAELWHVGLQVTAKKILNHATGMAQNKNSLKSF